MGQEGVDVVCPWSAPWWDVELSGVVQNWLATLCGCDVLLFVRGFYFSEEVWSVVLSLLYIVVCSNWLYKQR